MARVLMYHDVIPDGAPTDYSGFPGASAAAYKLALSHFKKHLSEVNGARSQLASVGKTIDEVIAYGKSPKSHALITFDDGGVSAITHIAPLLESLGWRGHFFVPTDFIDRPGFLTTGQIADLDRRGHVVGSHSSSHPLRMADLDPELLRREWRQSLDALAHIVGHAVDIASVPGGFYSRNVGLAAQAAGVRVMFTSEPEQTFRSLGSLTLVGRYALVQSDPPTYARDLVIGAGWKLQRQWLSWNAKKAVKRVAGRPYLWARECYFKGRLRGKA
jgi:peptidoglycan/xylan/chitin deacetylase (PgdA/CDA1 family)